MWLRYKQLINIKSQLYSICADSHFLSLSFSCIKIIYYQNVIYEYKSFFFYIDLIWVLLFLFIDLSWVLHIMLMQYDFGLMSMLHVIRHKILFWTHLSTLKVQKLNNQRYKRFSPKRRASPSGVSNVKMPNIWHLTHQTLKNLSHEVF